jgi:ParB-like nuclease domain
MENAMSIKQVSAVFETKNYGMFTLYSQNRPIRPYHVEKLIGSIRKKNLLKEKPILVDKEHRILDGQHRLKAAEELDVPIYFHYGVATIKDVPLINQNQEKWTPEDYVHLFVCERNKHYISLAVFREAHPGFSVSSAMFLLDGKRYDEDIFHTGRWTIGDYEKADAMAKQIQALGMYVNAVGKEKKFHKEKYFVTAFVKMYNSREYSYKKFMARLKKKAMKFKRQASVKDYIAMLENIHGVRFTWL